LSYKPWFNEKDKDEVFFSSIHLFGGEQFYPGSGQEHFNVNSSSTDICSNGSTCNPNIVNIELHPIDPGPWNPVARSKLTPAKRENLCKQASHEFRLVADVVLKFHLLKFPFLTLTCYSSKVTAMLLPKLREFRPELLIISAGFDAHYDDFYHFLTEEDIHWITDEMCKVVDDCGGYGVVSVLEGGYSLSSPIGTLPPKIASKCKEGGGGDSYGTRGKKKNASNVKDESIGTGHSVVDSHTMYAQQPGDGGLVKG
jgi:hypothetical protein